MGNGHSLVLGSSLSESEGSELMEGAAAAVGRQQVLYSRNRFHPLVFLRLGFFLGSAEFQLMSETQEDPAPRNVQATPTKKTSEHSADSTVSTLSRPSTLHKQPPALPPKPFNRLPNHLTGTSFSL